MGYQTENARDKQRREREQAVQAAVEQVLGPASFSHFGNMGGRDVASVRLTLSQLSNGDLALLKLALKAVGVPLVEVELKLTETTGA